MTPSMSSFSGGAARTFGFGKTTPSTGLFTWGANGSGQLGLVLPGAISQLRGPVNIGYLQWQQIVAGPLSSLAIRTNGTLWAWGSNNDGGLGLGDTTARNSPVQVGTLTNWQTVVNGIGFSSGVYTLAVKTDGTLWAWGTNANGQLGLGDTTARSSPVQVGALTNWSTVTVLNSQSLSGRNTFAIKTDGTLWGWGWNAQGELGTGVSAFSYSSPVQIGALANWKTVSTNDSYTAAVKTDGTLWTWGLTGNGTLGLNNTTNYSSPVQVGTLTNWSTVAVSSAGFMIATKTDGTLWAWGANFTYGYLGLGDTTTRSSPVQVGALTNWQSISTRTEFTLAIKTDGTLWGWGRNTSGQLGPATASGYSSPIQIGNSTNWSSISAGSTHALAIRSLK